MFVWGQLPWNLDGPSQPERREVNPAELVVAGEPAEGASRRRAQRPGAHLVRRRRGPCGWRSVLKVADRKKGGKRRPAKLDGPEPDLKRPGFREGGRWLPRESAVTLAAMSSQPGGQAVGIEDTCHPGKGWH